MEFQDVVRRRRMVRRFTAEPVPEQSLERLLRNAVRGPSAGFSQGQEFLVLRGAELASFWEVIGEDSGESVTTAPLVIVPFAGKNAYLDRYAMPDKGWTDRDEARWPVPFWYIDTGMAALLILQTAVDEGLGALYFGIVPEAVRPFLVAFGVPAGYDPIGAIAIGYDGKTASVASPMGSADSAASSGPASSASSASSESSAISASSTSLPGSPAPTNPESTGPPDPISSSAPDISSSPNGPASPAIPQSSARRIPRRSADDVIHYGRW